MNPSKGGGKGEGEMPRGGVTSSPTGSPTRLEMGMTNMQSAAETPVPDTPPNGPVVGQQGFSMCGQSFGGVSAGNVGVQNLAGAPNLAAQSLAGVSHLAGVPNLAGCQNPLGPQQFVGAPDFGVQRVGGEQGLFQQNVASGSSSGCCGQPFVAGTPCPQSLGYGICQGNRGQMPPGGLTPQASVIRQVADLVGQLDPNQTRELQLILNERMTGQTRMVPEYFGEIPRHPGRVGFFGEGPTLPGAQALPSGEGYDSWYGGRPLDVFAKSEKWLTPAPVPDTSKWVNRESEIMGFSEYLSMLTSWAAQASLEFAQEIEQASRWGGVLHWDALSGPSKNRSTRLLAILRNAFLGHSRTSMLISAFLEGVSLDSHVSVVDPRVARDQTANGYELLRQLTTEFSLQSRAEALALRTTLVNRTFNLKSESSGTSQVADVIRRIDYEAARYARMLGTLPASVDATGLGMPEADLLLLLLKNLPEHVRSFCLHHASGESYMAYRSAARHYEERQRLFGDSKFGTSKNVSQLVGQGFSQGSEVSQGNDETDPEGGINAVNQGPKCGKCGSRKHSTNDCSTDLSKVRCFKCNSYGHIGAHCPNSKRPFSNDSSNQTGKGNGKHKGKGKPASKGKSKGSKGKGYGKKGKLNEVSEETADAWGQDESSWWDDSGWNDSSWDDSAWWSEGWIDSCWDSGWYSQEQTEWNGSNEDSKNDGTVGSLIISGLHGEEEEDFATGLFLSDACPQPFDVVETELQCKRMFCGCSDCLEKQRVFSEAWSKAKTEQTQHGTARDALGSRDWSAVDSGGVAARSSAVRELHASEVAGCPGAFGLGGLEVQRSGTEGTNNDTSKQALDGRRDFGFGLKGPRCETEVNCGCFSGLISPLKSRVSYFRFSASSFLTCPRDTVSQMFQLRRYGPVLWPLLSELSIDDSTWWLLDSGASTTVLAERFAKLYGVSTHDLPQDASQYRAANGTEVKMKGRASVGVNVLMTSEWGDQQTERHAQLRALIGNIQHNIISTTSLCRAGWEFWQGSDWFEIRNKKTGEKATEVGFFAGCPWLKVRPGPQKSSRHVTFACNSDCPAESLVAPLTRAGELELQKHRLQGHTPHDPRCVQCAKGRTVFQHRRRREGVTECELQADFAFLSVRGEFTEEEVDNCFKVLVMTEMSSNCVGYVVVHNDLAAVRGQIVKWLEHFGLNSERSSIVLTTDAERSVSQLISRSSTNFSFTVRRASPQQHRSVGGAERGVRRLKESLSVLRADMNESGYDVPFTLESLQHVTSYLALTHNHFAKAPSSDLSPLEFVAARRLSKPHVGLYGMTVLAELPSSLVKDSPNETRNIEAMYLHPGLGTGPVVQGRLRSNGEMVLKRFVARNLKPIFPVDWRSDLAGDLLVKVDSGRDAPIGDGMRPSEIGDVATSAGGVGSGSPAPDYVEYPDGAPPELVREMKEADDSLIAPSPQKKRREPPVVGDSSRPLTMRRQGPLVQAPATEPAEVEVEAERDVSVSVSRPTFSKTARCPACDSGMVAPGIRHNAECKRRFAEFKRSHGLFDRASTSPATTVADSPEVSGSSPGPDIAVRTDQQVPDMEGIEEEADPPGISERAEPSEEYRLRFKRSAPSSVDDLEREMDGENDEANMGSLMDLDLFWTESGQPMLASLTLSDARVVRDFATSPSFFDGEVDSIQFSSKGGHRSVTMTLGGATVLLWEPDEIIDDSTLASLDPKLGFQGMHEEIKNLDDCRTGECLTEPQVSNLKQKHPGVRVIGCRWVSAFKSDTRVRCRIVAKDLARGSSAKALGFSSPTPSIEGLHLFLTLAANRNHRLLAVDVSHAFMHSPIPKDEWIILRMPLSVSFESGEPVHMLLHRSLNGLRNASAHWMLLLSRTIQSVGLWSDSIEPCIYGGFIRDPESNEVVGSAMLVAYVDDILIASSSLEAEEIIVKTIGSVVPVKTTGQVHRGEDGGGELTFIGRKISRHPGHSGILLSVDDKYLASTYEEFGIASGSTAAPDVAAHLEKTVSDVQAKKPLSPESYRRFRRCLGRLLWLSQSRHDLKVWLSLIGTQQAAPCQGTEAALRSVLRFLVQDSNVFLALPSNDYHQLDFVEKGQTSCFLHSFADASFGPYRFNGRKGISGGIVMFEGGLVRAFARQQQALSLSSCEAEIYAVQLLSQEAVAFSYFTHRLLFSIGEVSEPEVVKIMLESDSSSALQLLYAEGLPRRSRHIEIRLLWLQEQMKIGKIQVKHRAGTENPADLFTKCLPTKTFLKHRSTIGFVKWDGPLCDILHLAPASDVGLAFVEVCCSEKSAIRTACQASQIPYAGVTKDVEMLGVQRGVQNFVGEHRNAGRWVHMHFATPCSSGSPLKNFHSGETEADQVWSSIMSGALKLLSQEPKCHSLSFELPKNNSVWERKLTVQTLEKGAICFSQDVHLCQAQYKSKDGQPIGKVLQFRSSHETFCKSLGRRFGFCACIEHAPVSRVSWTDTGYYNRTLARAIINAAKAARKEGCKG